jgi:hypothetical protein
MQLEIVTIGDELLLGFTIDINGAHLARELAQYGITVARRTTAPTRSRPQCAKRSTAPVPSLSEWVARHLESLGHEVIVADPNDAPMYANRSRRTKTDTRDARTLMDACETGAWRLA